MNITEVRVKLVSSSAERLKAFCSVTLDGAFVVRDLKIIEGTNGPFVAMPSRKLADRCPGCGGKNHLRARFCNECGARLKEDRAPRDDQGRIKLHADVAHPINAACREQIQTAVIDAYVEEAERAKEPDYRPAVYDDDDYGSSDFDEFLAELREPAARKEREHHTSEKKAKPDSAVQRKPAAEPQPVVAPSGRQSKAAARTSKAGNEGQAVDDFASGIL